MASADRLINAVREIAQPLPGENASYDSLIQAAGDARFVLIGEASHGTHDFYRTRAEITKRLIEQKGFTAVIAEADWPDAYRVNRYVRGIDDDGTAVEALSDFRRFPAWMWRNADIVDFVGWLRDYNSSLESREQMAGFYGMDLYSLYGSIQAVMKYLDRVDPEVARRARFRYGCLEHFGEDPQAYGYAAAFDLSASCEQDVIGQLAEMVRHAGDYAKRDGRLAEDEYFFALQNARLVLNAEHYYRTMFRGRVSSWNLRDEHMAETIDALIAHLDRPTRRAKVIVWAHNSHLGDARVTDMGRSGEFNVGQLLREHHGQEVFSIGFTTHTGTVTAASMWDGPAERKRVQPSLYGSYERIFHETSLPQFLLMLRTNHPAIELLREQQLERAIGVIYLPETERVSHYFYASLSDQFDAVIHIDQTRAVEPLERTAAWKPEEVPETYPTAL
ncbi:MAG: erythromycin esterase family protein [Bacillota bacterium]